MWHCSGPSGWHVLFCSVWLHSLVHDNPWHEWKSSWVKDFSDFFGACHSYYPCSVKWGNSVHPKAWSQPCHGPHLSVLPLSPDGFSTVVSLLTCAPVAGRAPAAARYYFKNRPSMTRNSEKYLKVQDCREKKPHCSKETLPGVRAFCMIHGQHGTWNISVVPFLQRAVFGIAREHAKVLTGFLHSSLNRCC